MTVIDVVIWSPKANAIRSRIKPYTTVENNYTIYAYRFPETNLSTFTQLVVQETQEAILFSKGQIVGKFGPGKHTLNTENLPLLRTLYGIPFGGKNPFTAEVWFVNKVESFDIDWQIDRMDIHDADYNTGIPLVANGKYGIKISNPEKFLLKIVGTKDNYDELDLTKQFYGEFSTKTKSSLMQFMLRNKIGLKQISAYLSDISEHLRTVMNPFWENIGFELTKFYLTSIEVDSTNDVGKRVLEAISRQSAQTIGGYSWQQSQAFEVAKDAVNNIGNGGLLGALVAGNMVGGAGGAILQPQYNQPNFNNSGQTNSNNTANNGNQPPAQLREVYCSNCSKKFANNLKFCPHCGDEYCPCPKCGTDNDKNAKKCVSCGQLLLGDQSICPNCSSVIENGTTFCGNCGKPVSEGKCSRCGTSISENVKFCPQCGQKNMKYFMT